MARVEPTRTDEGERGIGSLLCLLLAVLSLPMGLFFVPAALALALGALIVAGPQALRAGPDRRILVGASVVAIVSLLLSVTFLLLRFL